MSIIEEMVWDDCIVPREHAELAEQTTLGEAAVSGLTDSNSMIKVNTSDFVLKSIRIENFKSYSGVYEINPFPADDQDSLICVVGPNGAGKSNIMDSVAFCFSCADSSKLRGDGLISNLIASKALSEDPNACASVTVSLVSKPSARSSGDISFSRTVNNRNESRYKLNNKTVTLEKYRERMRDCGLDTRGNFLVFQGDVESLALATPAELGVTIDRVSGSSQFKKEYEENKEKKVNLETELSSLMSKKRSLMNDRKRFLNEVGDLEKAKSLKSFIDTNKTKCILAKLFSLKNGLDIVGIMATTTTPTTATVSELSKIFEESKSKRAKSNMVRAKLERAIVKDDHTLSTQKSTVDERRAKLDTCQSQLTHLEGEIGKKNLIHDQLNAQIISIDSQLKLEQTEMENAMIDLENFFARKTFDFDYESDKDVLLPFMQKVGGAVQIDFDSFRKKLVQLRQVVIPSATRELTSHMGDIDIHIRQHTDKLSILMDRERELTDQMTRNIQSQETVSSKLEAAKKVLVEKETAFTTALGESKSIVSRMERFEKKINELLERKQILIDELSTMKDDEDRMNREEKILEILGNLKSKFGSEVVLGRFIDLVAPVDAKWAIAIQTAAGKYLDAVFVSNVLTARKCAEWIKESKNRISMTFIPIQDIVVVTAGVSNITLPPKCLRGIDCVTSTSPLQTVAGIELVQRGIEFVLGDVVFCDSLRSAREFAFKHGRKVISVNGEKICGKNGTISIGDGGGRKSKNRFELKNISDITKKIDLVETQISDTRVEISDLKIEANKSAARNRSIEISLNEIKRDINIWRSEEERLVSAITVLGSSIDDHGKNRESIYTDFESLKAKKIEIMREIESVVCNQSTEWLIENMSVPANVAKMVSVDIKKRIGGCENDASKSAKSQFEENRKMKKNRLELIENRVESLRNERRFVSEQVLGMVNTLADMTGSEQSLKLQKSKIEKDLGKAEKDLANAQELMARQRDDLTVIINEVECFDRTIREQGSSIAIARAVEKRNQDASAIRAKNILEIKSQIQRVLQSAVYDNILVPLVLGPEECIDGASVSEMSKKILEALFVSIVPVVDGDVCMDTTVGDHDLVDEVFEKIDFSPLSSAVQKKLKTTSAEDVLGRITGEFESEIAEKKNELEKLNIRSSSQDSLAHVELELEQIVKQIDLKKVSLDALVIEIKRIRDSRNELFMKCFNFVAQKVGELYHVLTDFDHQPNNDHEAVVPWSSSSGATASLDLEIPASPEAEYFASGIIFSLMPPFKRYTNIELLSGGEKTVAAVALIFSILSFMSPPFAIVDEIDAALDAGNVEVLARFMKRAISHPLIVISLKEKMYSKADYLIGVYKDLGGSSGLVTVDLRSYPEIAPPEVYEQQETVSKTRSRSQSSTRRLTMGA